MTKRLHSRHSSSGAIAKGAPLPHALTPNPSHFRLVSLTTAANKYLDPMHKRMFLPQWKYSQAYEELLLEQKVPYKTEDIAYTLPHLLEKVNTHSGIPYTSAYTETGRLMHSLLDLPDYLSTIILCAEGDDAPQKVEKKKQSPKRQRGQQLVVLASLSLPKIRVIPSVKIGAEKHKTSLSIPSIPPPADRIPRAVKSKDQFDSNPITLSGESILPPLSERTRVKSLGKTGENSREHSPDADTAGDLTRLFSANQLEMLRKEYENLRHLTLVERVNDAVQTSARLPGNVKSYLTQLRSKIVGNSKFQDIFARYLQGVIPVMQGKPSNVFRSVLRGLGSDGRGLSWPQWLLLNSLLIHPVADSSIKITFVSHVTFIQMFGAVPDYMDVLVTLTSLCRRDQQNREFQMLFQQLKAVFAEGLTVTPSVLRRKCLIGAINYELVIHCLREEVREV